MQLKKTNVTQGVLAVLLSCCVAACTFGDKLVHHGFSYGSITPNPRIWILDYQYGDRMKDYLTRPSRQSVEEEHVAQSTGMAGYLPLGNFLYVKWRDNSNGQVQERKIDLKGITPAEMTDKELHFDFEGSKLQVFVISIKKVHARNAANCPARGYEIFDCTRIYSD